MAKNKLISFIFILIIFFSTKSFTNPNIDQWLESEKTYKVGGWASVNENTEGPPVWELVEKYIRRKKNIQIEKNNSVKVITG